MIWRWTRGWHVAPTNNQNNHNGQWGDASEARTVVLAKSLTEEALYAAMKDRRSTPRRTVTLPFIMS